MESNAGWRDEEETAEEQEEVRFIQAFYIHTHLVYLYTREEHNPSRDVTETLAEDIRYHEDKLYTIDYHTFTAQMSCLVLSTCFCPQASLLKKA